MSGMDYYITAQVLGFIALGLEMLRFQLKSSRLFFYIEPFLSTIYFFQFFLLGALSAYAVSALSIARAFCGALLNQEQLRKIVIYFFIPSFLTIGFFTADSLLNSLPTLAILFSTTAFLIRDQREIVVRLYILNCLCWLVYAIPYEAYAHAIACCLILCSLIIGIFRHEEKYRNLLYLTTKLSTPVKSFKT